VNDDEIGPLSAEASLRSFSAMGRTVVDDPEYSPGCEVGGLAHNLVDEATERDDTGSGLATAVDLGAPYIPGSKVGPGTESLVFMLDPEPSMGSGFVGRMTAPTRLNAGFLVGTDNILVRKQRLALPEAFVKVQDTSRFLLECRIAGEDPAAVAPRLDGVLREPPPQRGFTNGSDETAAEYLALDLRDGVARQGQALALRELTSQGLDGDHHAGGKSGLAARPEAARADPRGVVRRTACATC